MARESGERIAAPILLRWTAVPLRDAAQKAYDRTSQCLLSQNAAKWEGEGRFPALDLFVDMLTDRSHGIALYGRPVGAKAYVAIPDYPRVRAAPGMRHGVVVDRLHNNTVRYLDVVVTRADLRRFIDGIWQDDATDRADTRARMEKVRQTFNAYRTTHNMPLLPADPEPQPPKQLLARAWAYLKGMFNAG